MKKASESRVVKSLPTVKMIPLLLLVLVQVNAQTPVPGQSFLEIARKAQSGDAAAIRQLNVLADKDDSHAQFILGVMYQMGEFVPKDINLALNWYQRAYENGNPNVANLLGSMYEEGRLGLTKDLKSAIEWYRRAAVGGDPYILFHLGWMYENGEGTPKDIGLAIHWYSLAAEKNYPLAQAYLANLYHRGEGVSQDLAAAAKLYRKAADQGYGFGMWGLGQMYRFGEGLPKDFVTAYMWYNLASSHGFESSANRDSLEKEMTRDQIAEAQKLSREWKPKTVAEP